MKEKPYSADRWIGRADELVTRKRKVPMTPAEQKKYEKIFKDLRESWGIEEPNKKD